MSQEATFVPPIGSEKRPQVLLYLVGIVVVVAVGVATYLQLALPPAVTLQRFRAVPDFRLTDQNGRPVSLGDLRGKVWLADFIYTTCPGPCPMVTRRVHQLQDEAFKNADVRFVSFTMDPVADTPPVLNAYARKFGTSPDKWIFLTGSKDLIFHVVRDGFTLAVTDQPGAGEQPIVHSTKLALVDKSGTIRAYYDGTGPDQSETILRDMRALLRE